MADEKKPKIDLKARLGKTNVAAPPPAGVPIPPPPVAGMPGNTPSTRPPGGSIPVPRGISPSGIPAGLDPSSPIVAAMQQQVARAQPAPPPQPQRIEVDESTVTEASAKARKQGVMIGLVVAVVLGVVGYVAGGAMEQSSVRSKSVSFAQALSKDATTAKGQLEKIAAKVEEARDSLGKKKYPDGLGKDLRGLNVDFDGLKLQGARFSGFSMDTTQNLMAFISQVQTVNDRRQALANLLDSLQKPISEMWTGKPQTLHIAVLQRTPRGPFAQLALLKDPITADPPNEFITAKPTVAKVGKFNGDLKDAPAAAPIAPGSFESMCPSEVVGQVAQLGAQLRNIITEIRGEKETPDNPIEAKPGLLKRADALIEGLNKVK